MGAERARAPGLSTEPPALLGGPGAAPEPYTSTRVSSETRAASGGRRPGRYAPRWKPHPGQRARGKGARPGLKLLHCPATAEVAAPAPCLLLSDPAVQQLRSPGVHRVPRPPGRGVPAPGRQLAKAQATAGHSRVAWPPAQGYAASHPAAPGVPVTLRSAVEQSWYHWPGSLVPQSGCQELGETSRWCSNRLTSCELHGESGLLML